jgi:hypothetical protein
LFVLLFLREELTFFYEKKLTVKVFCDTFLMMNNNMNTIDAMKKNNQITRIPVFFCQSKRFKGKSITIKFSEQNIFPEINDLEVENDIEWMINKKLNDIISDFFINQKNSVSMEWQIAFLVDTIFGDAIIFRDMPLNVLHKSGKWTFDATDHVTDSLVSINLSNAQESFLDFIFTTATNIAQRNKSLPSVQKIG